jgi:hypothetical protein
MGQETTPFMTVQPTARALYLIANPKCSWVEFHRGLDSDEEIASCVPMGLFRNAKTFKNTAFLRVCVNQTVFSSSHIRGADIFLQTLP